MEGRKKYYEVKHLHMRNAQVFTANPALMDSEKRDGYWKDFSDEPIIDIVPAINEDEAVRMVSMETGYSEDCLIAEEHVVDAFLEIEEGRKKRAVTAAAFQLNGRAGVEVTLLDDQRVRVMVNNRKEVVVEVLGPLHVTAEGIRFYVNPDYECKEADPNIRKYSNSVAKSHRLNYGTVFCDDDSCEPIDNEADLETIERDFPELCRKGLKNTKQGE